MIQNYLSSDVIIAKVLSDLDIQEEGQRVTDMREWIFEAIEKIGAATQYDHKESNTEDTPLLKITNYQAPLPDDVYKIKTVAYSRLEKGPWQPMRSNTGSFKMFPDKGTPNNYTDKGSMDDNSVYPTLVPKNGTRNTTNFSYDFQYFLKPGYIVTNMREGYIKLSYSSMVTDDRGYPMVPDLASYQEAIYWYVVMKLKYPEFLRGTLPENRYTYIHNRWNFYRNQAYAEAIMPGEGEMISIKNNWLRLVPDINAEQTFYSTNGQQEHIWNNYYGRVY